MLKEIIKTLAEEQTQLKIARKTGPYKIPFKEMDGYRWPDYSQVPEIRKMLDRSWWANNKILDNAIKITAAHNLQHELKGSAYRHNVPEHKQYVYKREYEALKTSEAQLRASPQTKA